MYSFNGIKRLNVKWAMIDHVEGEMRIGQVKLVILSIEQVFTAPLILQPLSLHKNQLKCLQFCCQSQL